jgi:hypothetical protein
MSDPDYDVAEFLAPLSAESIDAWIDWQVRLQEHLPERPLEDWTSPKLREALLEKARAHLASQRLPDWVVDELRQADEAANIITGARLMCAVINPELLPGIDSAVMEHATEGTLGPFADKLARDLEHNLISTVVLMLDPT